LKLFFSFGQIEVAGIFIGCVIVFVLLMLCLCCKRSHSQTNQQRNPTFERGVNTSNTVIFRNGPVPGTLLRKLAVYCSNTRVKNWILFLLKSILKDYITSWKL